MYGHNEKCTCVFCAEARGVMGASSGTDQRLDMLIRQNNRQIEQLGQIIDLGIEAVAAIKALLPEDAAASPDAAIRPETSPDAASGPGADRQLQRERPQTVEIQEPARRRKKP